MTTEYNTNTVGTPKVEYTFDSIPLETPLPETASIPVVPGTKRPGDVVAPLVPVLPVEPVVVHDKYYVEAPESYKAAAKAEGPAPTTTATETAQSAAQTAQSAAQTAAQTAQSAASAAGSALSNAAQYTTTAVQQSGIIPKAQELASQAASTISSAASTGAVKAKEALNSAAQPPVSATTSSVPATTAVPTTIPTTVPNTTGYVHVPGTPATVNVLPSESTYEERSLPVTDTTNSSATPGVTPGVAARAGDVAGSVAGTVGGTLSTAASIAKNAASSLLGSGTGSERSIEEQNKPDVLVRAGATAGTVAGSVAGTLATLAGAAKNAAVSAVHTVYPASTTTERELPPSTVRPEQKYDLAYNAGALNAAKEDEIGSYAIPAEAVVAKPTATEQIKSTAATAAGAAAGAAQAAYNAAANTASSAYNATANTAGAAYNAAANTAGAARDTVVNTASSAYNTVANTTAAAKDTAANTAASTYNSAADTGATARDLAASTYVNAADKAAQYTAGWKSNAGTKYELTESSLEHPVTDVRADAADTYASSATHTGQLALPPVPAEHVGTRVNEVPSFVGGDNISTLPSASALPPVEALPGSTHDATGLITDEAIRAVATPADHRTGEQQAIVDSLLSERDLTSVGQPNVEFGTGSSAAKPAHIESALPADEKLTGPPSDDASTRSIAPASILERGSVDAPIEDTSSTFDPTTHMPADPIQPDLASHRPTTSTIPEQPELSSSTAPTTTTDRDISSTGHNTTDSSKKPSKAHGFVEKAIGKIQASAGKVLHKGHLVDVGQERHAAGAAEIESVKNVKSH